MADVKEGRLRELGLKLAAILKEHEPPRKSTEDAKITALTIKVSKLLEEIDAVGYFMVIQKLIIARCVTIEEEHEAMKFLSMFFEDIQRQVSANWDNPVIAAVRENIHARAKLKDGGAA